MTPEERAPRAPAGRGRERPPALEAAFRAIVDARDDPARVVRLLAEYPDEEDADAFVLGGEALLALGRYRLAREAFEQAVRLDPVVPGASRGLAAVERREEDGGLVVHWHVGTASWSAPAPPPAPPPVMPPHTMPVAVAAFAVLASAAAAFGGVRLVTMGVEGIPSAVSLLATAMMGLAVAAGLAQHAPLAWWAGEGFAAGGGVSAFTSVVLTTAQDGVTPLPFGLGIAAVLVALTLGLVLWQDRRYFLHDGPCDARA